MSAARGALCALVLTLAHVVPAGPGEPQSAATPEGGAWHSFRSEEGRFGVLLPDPPRDKDVSHWPRLGPRIEAREFSALHNGTEFRVEHYDLPSLVKLLPAGFVLNRAKAGLLNDAGGRELSARELSRQGHAAREITFAIPQGAGAVEQALLVLAESRLYIVAARRPSDAAEDAGIERFFASFHFWLR